MKRAAVCVLASLLFAGVSRADLIVPVSQDRHVAATVGTQTQRFDAPDFGPFVQTAGISDQNGFASAPQNSSIGPNSITGTLSAASQGFGPTAASAQSVMQVVFNVPETVAFTFSGHGTGGLVGGFASLTGPGVSLTFAGLWNGGPPFNQQGQLGPGQYTFLLSTSTNSTGQVGAGVTGTLSLQSIPAPSAGAVLGLGALVLRRRRRVTQE